MFEEVSVCERKRKHIEKDPLDGGVLYAPTIAVLTHCYSLQDNKGMTTLTRNYLSMEHSAQMTDTTHKTTHSYSSFCGKSHISECTGHSERIIWAWVLCFAFGA